MPSTHDLTNRTWGRDYAITEVLGGGQRISMTGWLRGIADGDYLLLADGHGGTTRYRVILIHYYRDPPDMFRAKLSFAPRDQPLDNAPRHPASS